LKKMHNGQESEVKQPRVMMRKTKNTNSIWSRITVPITMSSLFCGMALGGRVSLHYDDELHFKVHCNRALAQHHPRGLGL
jgi:hypothetical protein